MNMNRIAIILATIAASISAHAQVIALKDGKFAIKQVKANPKDQKTDSKILGDGTGTCAADSRVLGDGTGTCAADSKVLGDGTGTCAADSRVLGDGTGTCAADSRVLGDGTGTCAAESKVIVFDHPSLLSSKQLVELLKQTSSDLEREQIIQMLKDGK